MARETSQYYIAKEGGYAIIDGEHMSFRAGVTTVEKGHPLLKSCPDSFIPFTPTYPVKPKSGVGSAAA